jgi:hypothetical protein
LGWLFGEFVSRFALKTGFFWVLVLYSDVFMNAAGVAFWEFVSRFALKTGGWVICGFF